MAGSPERVAAGHARRAAGANSSSTEQQRLLDDFIRRELLVQRAGELGYRVSDRELAEAHRGDPRAAGRRQVLPRPLCGAAALRRAAPRPTSRPSSAATSRSASFSNAVAGSAFAMPGELRRRVELEGETRDVQMLLLPAAEFAAGVAVTAEQVADCVREERGRLPVTPESVDLQYVAAQPRPTSQREVEVTDEALREYYDAGGGRALHYHRAPPGPPHPRRGGHATTRPRRRRAEQAGRARREAGEDFAALAAQNSDDPGSKGQGGDLGWSTRESFVGAIRGCAVRHGAGRDPRPGADPVRLPRHQARGRRAAARSAASTKCAASSRRTTVASRRRRSSTSARSSWPTRRSRA